MILTFSDNIIAEITPAGRAAVSGLRISGRNAKDITEDLFKTKITKARHAYLLENELDEVVAVYYKAPNSYTGEDVCEIFCHGNPSIVNGIIDAVLLSKKFKTRMAQPGEFTKRAYLNDKIDLIQAEAVADIINSSSAIAVKYRNQVLKGGLSTVLDAIRKELIDISVFTELEIDFEEESAGVLDKKKALDRLEGILARTESILNSFSKIELLARDIRILIVGEANVGKSSVFNRLIEQERSIVHEHPGTTRDYIEAELFINGLEITLIDTAGFRETTNCEIEKMGIKKINDLMNSASMVLEITDKDTYKFKHDKAIKIRNKTDINKPNTIREDVVYTSIKDTNSIIALRERIAKELGKMLETEDDRAEHFLLTKRQKAHIHDLAQRIEDIIGALKKEHPIETVSFMLRDSIDMVNRLTGREKVSDDTLDELFSRFCIGK
ncbi:MAG: tRNA uridine-5-carboxymethylaminomethyl(34) synthesis GTPase MnmE [Proteobacteria bacterium]|nr:tRNA uridine-5-carboxymethylaminomethyl(34) synthesis GTPase MnmE [Pseudomonadota bacterium]